MTFEQWKEGEQWDDHCNPTDFAKDAWYYQQRRIDRLEAAWRDDDSLTLAYMRGYSDGKKNGTKAMGDWEATKELRWIERAVYDLDGYSDHKSFLQQKWKLLFSNEDVYEWRDVPMEQE